MNPSDYIRNVLRSESNDFHMHPSHACSFKKRRRMLHGAIGCCTEAGELLDQAKKVIFYGKKIDETNIEEELGDLLWYIALLCDVFNFKFEDIMEKNIAKLKLRYPEKFTQEKALNRDLDAERKVLEEKNIADTKEDMKGIGL